RRLYAVVLLLGLLGFVLACARAEDAPADHAVSVRTARVEGGAITEWIRLYGRIAPPPDRDATLAPLVAGLLLAVPVREGQSVRAGEILARVEGAPLDRKSTRLNSSHDQISYAGFCVKKKNQWRGRIHVFLCRSERQG